MRSSQTAVDGRSHEEHRSDDIIGTINVRRTNDLNVWCSVRRQFGNERSNILIDIGCQNSLDKEHMVIPLNGFKNPEIIHISVIVKVQIRKHV